MFIMTKIIDCDLFHNQCIKKGVKRNFSDYSPRLTPQFALISSQVTALLREGIVPSLVGTIPVIALVILAM